jgi:hypothetical protein
LRPATKITILAAVKGVKIVAAQAKKEWAVSKFSFTQYDKFQQKLFTSFQFGIAG